MAVEFRLLGPVVAHVDGVPVDLGHARQRCVLAALLVDANRPVSADVLLDRVWGQRPPQRARNALAGYVSRLRGSLAGVAGVTLARRPEGYQLGLDADSVDLHRFRRLAAEARTAADDRAAIDLLEEALRQWRGRAFEALDTPWTASARASLESQRLAVTLERNDIALRLGRQADMVAELSKLADEHPLDERLAAQLMLALYRCGRQADALHHYESVRVRLADELGADPGPDLQALHQRVLRTDPALLGGGPSPAAPVPRQLPAGPASFVGRADEVTRLDGALTRSESSIVIYTITGAPGVGKTALALHWAHRVAHRFTDGQLYLNLRGYDPGGSAVTPADALWFLLDSLGVQPRRIPATVEARAALYRTMLAGRRVLVVLDNAREAEQVRPLLPGTGSGVVVVTSRATLGGLVMSEAATPVTLDVLTVAESRRLLTARLRRDAVGDNPAAVTDIVTRCGGLPLALAVIAARVSTNAGLTLDKVAVELGGADDPLDVLADGEPGADVRAVFSWSYATLGPAAARMFRRLGLHPGPDVGLAGAASLDGTPLPAARTAMAELTRAHLVTQTAPDRFTMHDLLCAYAVEMAAGDDQATRRAATTRLFDHYLHTAYAAAVALHPHRHLIDLPPPADGAHVATFGDLREAVAWFRAEHDSLVAVAELAARDGYERHAWQLAWTLTDYLDRQGHWQQQLALQDAALAAARALDDVGAQAATHRALGRAWGTIGRLDESIHHYRLALERYEAVGDRAAQAHSHLSLSWVLERRGGLAEAIEHDERALELFRALDHPLGQARALNHLGCHRLEAGDHRRAVEDCTAALALFGRVGDRLGEAATHDSLGQAQQRLGRYDEAVTSFERSLEMLRALGDRYYEALTTTHLGDAHHGAGRTRAARDAWGRALDILTELGHPDADAVRARLATGA